VDKPSSSRASASGSAISSGNLPAILFLIGFTAVIAQIVLMRELMVVFYGNEMSLGIMLASWLLWTAIGSGVLGRVTMRARNSRGLMASLEVLIAAAFPLTIYLVRASKGLFQSVPGEMLGPGPMILTSLLVLSVFCLISGALFAAGSRLYAEEAGTSTVAGMSQVYLREAAGSALGGILASILLIRYFADFEIAALLVVLNLMAAASLTLRPAPRRSALLAALAVVLAFPIFFGCRWLERVSLNRLWSGYHLLAARNSVYGNVAVVQTGASRSLLENGRVAFNVPDPAAAEEAVHYALLEHPSPKSLLLIGGGVNGSLAQALQHPSLERIDYVELDPVVLDLAQEFFPTEWAGLRADPRVHIHNTDGRLFLKATDLRFDVVIVNLPEPQTAQLNRFYTLEFFREVSRKLTPAGVFSFQLKASENYISPELAEFLRCIHKTLRRIFPEVTAIPGDTVHFFAATRAGILAADAQELIARIHARRLRTSYVREYFLPYRMMPDRMLDLESQIRPLADTRINRDFAPVAYYFDVALWSTRFNHVYRQAFQSLAQMRFGRLAAAAGLLLFAFAAMARWLSPRERLFHTTAGFCVAAMGFTLVGLEMLLLLGYQAIYGYVYRGLAILIAGFMAGMALGSWRALRRAGGSEARPNGRGELRQLAGLQLLAALAPLLLCLLFGGLAAIKDPRAVFLASQVLFPVLAVLCGLFGGYQFPVASRVFFAGSKNRDGNPGTLYALDLAGACLGALALSACLVPLFGFLETAALMAVVNLAPAILAGLLALGTESRAV
jgi:spermidine synthase